MSSAEEDDSKCSKERSIAPVKNAGKSGEVKTKDETKSNPSTSHMQPFGAGRPQMQRKQPFQKKPSVDTQKGFVKNDQVDSTKHRNNLQKNQNNFGRGSPKNNLVGKMNNLSINDPRRASQNVFPRNYSAGQANPNQQNLLNNNWRTQNHMQQQHQGVSPNYQANNHSPQNLPVFPSASSFSNSQYQRNQGSPPHLMQQNFPPLLYPGNEFYGPHESAPDSPGPAHSVAQPPLRYEFPVSGSPSFPGHNNFNPHAAPDGFNCDFGQCPPPNRGGPRSNNAGFVSPVNSCSSQGGHDLEPGSQQNVGGKKFQNLNGPLSFEGHSQKKQGNKHWKKNNNQFVPPLKSKRQQFPSLAVNQGSSMGLNQGPFMHISEQQQFPINQQVFVNQPNFGHAPNSIHPPVMSPISTAPYQQYVGQPQYTFAFYPGANYVPQQQWMTMAESQGNFVPYTSAEIAPYSMVPGMIPQSQVPYPVPPSVIPYANEPIVVTHTPGASSHGCVPAAPPLSNAFGHVLSLTVSSQVAPLSATAEAPTQFNLSQLDKAWEETPAQQQDKRNSSEAVVPAITPVPDAAEGPSEAQDAGRSPANEPRTQETVLCLSENLEKMMDVETLERIQRMSSANGKRAPMNARSKDSPNHMPPPPPEVQEEVIKFICDSWNKVYQELQKGDPSVAFHTDSDSSTLPEGFMPFDLEGYWDRRLVNNIQNIPTQNI